MRRSPSSVLLLLGLAGAPRFVAAQASPFLVPDDPRAALIEHLIARGIIRDPHPLERTWHRRELQAALQDSNDPAARHLLGSLGPAMPSGGASLSVKGGVQMFSQGRRDLLRAGGDEGARGYAEAGGSITRGPLVVAVRGAAENRLKLDPEWRARAEDAGRSVVLRVVEAYGGLDFGWGRLLVGQRSRSWGPSGVPGIAIADAGYPRPDIELGLAYRGVRFTGIATRMASVPGPNGKVERYFVAHRVTVTPVPSLTLAVWETAVIAGREEELDGKTRAVVPLLVVPALWASRAHRNEMVGGQVSWKPGGRLRLEAEIAIDDWNFDDSNPYPQRWAATVTGAGALGNSASWEAAWSTASSLAFHTLNPEENFTDGQVGIARLFPDNEEVSVRVHLPVRKGWLVSPRLALLRQGEGRLTDPFPTPDEAAAVPDRFIGIVARSLWAGASVAGSTGRLALVGEAGVRHIRNAEHQPGVSRTSVEARVTATLAMSLERPFR